MKITVVGSGLSGATAARLLKDKGHSVVVFETRNHIGGNCYDSILSNTLIHNYGPHIFHTDDEEVFSFLSKFTDWKEFSYRPKGITPLGKLSLPYSKKTIEEIGRELSQEEIIDNIFKHYSEKQWGIPFNELPKTITNRIPKTVKCDNPTWFEGQKYQCIPARGYTQMFNNMLEHIPVHLNCEEDEWIKYDADVVIYTGNIDSYYNFCHGKLPYRSLKFVHETCTNKLDNIVYNNCTSIGEYTRVYDHSYFNINHKGQTIITTEYPTEYKNNGDIPFYPMPWGNGQEIYNNYTALANKDPKTIFLGRTATYKYLDMWMAVKHAILKTKTI